MLRGFLIKLSSLDGQLLDNNGEYALLHRPPPSPLRDFDADFRIEECTFAVIIETNDDLAPSSNSTEVSPSSWAFTSSRLLTFFFLFLFFFFSQIHRKQGFGSQRLLQIHSDLHKRKTPSAQRSTNRF